MTSETTSSNSERPLSNETTQGSSKLPSDVERNYDQDEHFIPIRKRDLIRFLVQSLPEDSAGREKFSQLCHLLESLLHHEYHDCVKKLKDAYAN